MIYNLSGLIVKAPSARTQAPKAQDAEGWKDKGYNAQASKAIQRTHITTVPEPYILFNLYCVKKKK